MTWPTFNADLIYDEEKKTVKATGPMLSEYFTRHIDSMVIGIIQKDTNGDVSGAAFTEVRPGDGSLTLTRDEEAKGGNGTWEAILSENVEPMIVVKNGAPEEGDKPKRLVKANNNTFAIAFVKLV